MLPNFLNYMTGFTSSKPSKTDHNSSFSNKSMSIKSKEKERETVVDDINENSRKTSRPRDRLETEMKRGTEINRETDMEREFYSIKGIDENDRMETCLESNKTTMVMD
jgi:hypothetical protein